MISSDTIRGYNDIFLLRVLSQGDSYGYEIGKKIREMTDELYSIKETTLYSAFNRLEKNGYISSYPGVVTNGKKRTYYKITDLGKQYLEEKIAEWALTKVVVERFI
jgi:PadR family transcriptional regulator PadR